MEHIAFRLKPGQLLKEEIERIAVERGVKAGILLSVVGALQKCRLRMAGAEPTNQPVREWNEPLEIVAGTGTISDAGCHIHLSVSDCNGDVFGGHLKDGCQVAITAEIVLGILPDIEFKRTFDEETGWKELDIRNS